MTYFPTIVWNRKRKRHKSNTHQSPSAMRIAFVSYLFLISTLCGCEVIDQKLSRPLPNASIVEWGGLHSFVLLGTQGRDMPPASLPRPELWADDTNEICTFVLRDSRGGLRRQMVPAEVFNRYQVGECFDAQRTTETSYGDDKSVRPVQRSMHSRHRRHLSGNSRHRHSRHAILRVRRHSSGHAG